CILEQLTDQEKLHLYTYLMSPVIENTHPDYKAAMAFLSSKGDARVKLVLTASELIQDIATAIKHQFGAALTDSWELNCNMDIEPFVKSEDKKPDVPDDIAPIAKGEKVVDWTMDADILGDKRSGDPYPRQKDFSDMI